MSAEPLESIFSPGLAACPEMEEEEGSGGCVCVCKCGFGGVVDAGGPSKSQEEQASRQQGPNIDRPVEQQQHIV